MATVTQSFDSTIDMFAFDPDASGTVLARTSTTYSYLTRNGAVVTLEGSGFTYGASGPPVSGTIARAEVTPANEPAGAFSIVTTVAVSDLPSSFFTDGPAFWSTLLGGNDTFDLRDASNSSAPLTTGSVVYGDTSRFVGPGGQGGNDVMQLGDARGTFVGDVGSVGSTTVPTGFVGGDDTITGTAGAVSQVLIGDVTQVVWRETVVGGDDTLTLVSAGTVYGDVYRQLNGGSLTGGADVIDVAGTADHRVFGDAFELDDFAGALTFSGGDDRIDARGATGFNTIVGDASKIILSRSNGQSGPQIDNGDDNVIGGAGRDLIIGDIDFIATTVTVRLGEDVIRANTGADTIYGDYRELGANTNVLLLSGGDDVIDGGGGNDTIHGQIGNDVLRGGAGGDTIHGDVGADRLFGDAGNDALYGGRGADRLDGGDNNDILFGGAGGDVLDGGRGFDFVSYTDSTSGITIDAIDASANAGDAAGDTLLRIENLVGSNFDDTISGGNVANVLLGRNGDDVIDGRGGADLLDGGGGVDTLTGGAGFDTFRYRSVNESRAGRADTITDFDRRFDTIDLSRIDANENAFGDQAFDFIGQGVAFSGQAGELRYFVGRVEGDTDGDGRADLVIRLDDVARLGADDFVLLSVGRRCGHPARPPRPCAPAPTSPRSWSGP